MMLTTLLPYVPLRMEPSHKSEQCTQLLFGECAMLLEEKGEWALVQIKNDAYLGWGERKVLNECAVQGNPPNLVQKKYAKKTINDMPMLLPLGSELDHMTPKNNLNLPLGAMLDLARTFLGTPYLWGGKTYAGIDCSGFVQVLFKVAGIFLPRDASQQAEVGEPAHAEQVLPGDLAFFHNDKGKITHVGLMLSSNEIIHASGWVRVDKMDDAGIIQSETGNYSHKLNSIKRLKWEV